MELFSIRQCKWHLPEVHRSRDIVIWRWPCLVLSKSCSEFLSQVSEQNCQVSEVPFFVKNLPVFNNPPKKLENYQMFENLCNKYFQSIIQILSQLWTAKFENSSLKRSVDTNESSVSFILCQDWNHNELAFTLTLFLFQSWLCTKINFLKNWDF